MAFEVTVGTLDSKGQAAAADLLQKLEALEGAIIDVNVERNTFNDKINAKLQAIEKQKSVVKAELKALRVASIKEVV